MTQPSEAPRCRAVVDENALYPFCGLPLEPTGGPCVTCGHTHGLEGGPPDECGSTAGQDGLRAALHWCECRAPKPLACPVHGAPLPDPTPATEVKP